MDDTKIGIYCIENMINSKKYVGQFVDIYKRWNSHRSKLRRNVHYNEHLQSVWNQYGEDAFNFYVIEECSLNDLDIKEKYYIELYNLLDDNFGYNLETGGSFSKYMSEAERETRVDHRCISRVINGKQKHAGKHPDTGELLTWVKLEK